MTRWAYNLAIWLGVLVTLYALTACSDSKSRVEKEYIVRVGDRVLTVLDFNKAFEGLVAIQPLTEGDLLVRYVFCQIAAALISAVSALAYVRYITKAYRSSK